MEKIKTVVIEKVLAVKKIVLMTLLFVILMGGIIFAYQKLEGGEEITPLETIEEVTTAKAQPEKRKKSKAEKTVAMTIPENPFISSKEISAKAAEKTASTKAEEPETKAITPIELPSIPKTQVVQSQPVKMPSIPESRTIVNPLTMEEKKPETTEGNVQGIITTDSGKNIAIMSNGEVLTEGERYLDGRIAYIGGDGIEMDNGKKIKLKE